MPPMRLILAVLLLLLACAARAGEPELLEPEKAFRFSARLLAANQLEVRYEIAPGYYMYRDKFRFGAEPAYIAFDASRLPPGKIRKDEFFGEVQTYRGDLRLVLPVTVAGQPVERFTLKAVSQGCADIGVCYPPQEQTAEIKLTALASSASDAGLSPFLQPAPGAAAPRKPQSEDTLIAELFKGVGVIALLAGAALLIGALSGSRDVLRPLAGLRSTAAQLPLFQRVNNLAQFEAAVRTAGGKPVLLDFYADWCVTRKEMEALSFADSKVRVCLAQMLLLQADVTENLDEHKALLKRFGLFGPPGIVFFDRQGNEIKSLRVIGFQPADKFAATLDLVLQ
ncbi:MAG: thioredoxin fold domain-containing protein [Betaproteobacteria bacterium]|nr:thioredoxin fold domain-containing protein [Betaproteobacteria bacterium]